MTRGLGLERWIGVHQEELGLREVLYGYRGVYEQEDGPSETGKDRNQFEVLRMPD